jgi:hypothetical protein
MAKIRLMKPNSLFLTGSNEQNLPVPCVQRAKMAFERSYFFGTSIVCTYFDYGNYIKALQHCHEPNTYERVLSPDRRYNGALFA